MSTTLQAHQARLQLSPQLVDDPTIIGDFGSYSTVGDSLTVGDVVTTWLWRTMHDVYLQRSAIAHRGMMSRFLHTVHTLNYLNYRGTLAVFCLGRTFGLEKMA